MSQKNYWTRRDGPPDDELASLMEVAACALLAEDQRLAAGLRGTPLTAASGAPGWTAAQQGHTAIARVGHGLSYWVYETTLVYVIWRAWIESGRVAAWDWTLRELAGRERIPHGDGGLRYDLVLFRGDEPHAVFEAKWWNLDTDAVRLALDEDAAKLRGSRFFAGARKFLIVFWFEQKTQSDEMQRDVATFCAAAGLTFRGSAKFDANFLARTQRVGGSFVLGVLEA